MNEDYTEDYNIRLLHTFNNCQYPNLMAMNFYKLHLWSLAAGARVSEDVMKDVLKNKSNLTDSEKYSLANYAFVKKDFLFSPKVSILEKNKPRHKILMKKLSDVLYRIWDASQKGNENAIKFMKGSVRNIFVNMELDFINGIVVPYARYLQVKEDMEMAYDDVFGYKEIIRHDNDKKKSSIIRSNGVDDWNMKARKMNTQTFINMFHREPTDYQEVHDWVQSLASEADKQPLSKEAIEQYDSLGIEHDGYKTIGLVKNEIACKYSIGDIYKYGHLKFRVTGIKGILIFIHFEGNMLPDYDSHFELGSEVDKSSVLLYPFTPSKCNQELVEGIQL